MILGNGLNWPRKNLGLWLGVGIFALALITLLAAPNQTRMSGSTYSRQPDGYGAWYQFMADQGTPLQRWQRSFVDLAGAQTEAQSIPSPFPPATQTSPTRPASKPNRATATTLVRVHSQLTLANLSDAESKWLSQGNRMVVLGIYTPATKAAFRTALQTPVGSVRIESRRRQTNLPEEEVKLLADDRGTIVWRRTIGQGEAIFVNTPYLAANAYQDEPGNYPFLASLVAKDNHRLLVDEYLHGYRDQDVIHQETARNWMQYLATTALLPVLLQLVVGLLLLVWAGNQRFGLPSPLVQTPVNNSRAYINALAEVLRKAQSSDFVLEMISKEEQLHLQRALGLGNTPLDPADLAAAWVSQTGRSPQELQPLYQAAQIRSSDLDRPPGSKKQPLSEADLLSWLEKINRIRHSLPPSSL